MLVSVIIPTKNRPDFLKRALMSVLHQTKPVYEIIIVDDFSEGLDYTFLPKDPKIKLVCNTESVGGAKARNIGASVSTGDILMFLDDDDFWLPEKVEHQLEVFSKNEKVGFVFSGKQVVGDSDLKKVKRQIKPILSRVEHRDMFTLNYIGTTSSVAIGRDIFESVGGFDETLSCYQDYDLWIRVTQRCTAIYDEKFNVLYTVFDSNQQVSRKGDGRHQKTCHLLIQKYNKALSPSERKVFMSNLYAMTAKSLCRTAPFTAIKYSILANHKHVNKRNFNILLASLLSIFGLKIN